MRIANEYGQRIVLLLAVLFFVFGSAPGQENFHALKFDEFWYLRTEDEMARLDLFADQLRGKDLIGLIAGYRSEDWAVGSDLREIYGYRNYLVNKRGIPPEQLRVVYGGIRNKSVNELWVLPAGAVAPVEAAKSSIDLSSPVLFDNLVRGPDCWSEHTITLEEPEDAVKFFVEALRSNPSAKGYVLIRPSRRESAIERQQIETSIKQLFASPISGGNVSVSQEGMRSCGEVEFWIVADNFQVAIGTSVEESIKSDLMAYAEKNQHTFRRVEFVGNTYTRDDSLRSLILGLQEGNIFKTELLKSDLKSLNKSRRIKPVDLKDVDIRLNRAEKTIDLTIHVTEVNGRSRQR